MKRKYPTETLGPNKRPRGTISGAAHRTPGPLIAAIPRAAGPSADSPGGACSAFARLVGRLLPITWATHGWPVLQPTTQSVPGPPWQSVEQ
jgi:hypothetical protein